MHNNRSNIVKTVALIAGQGPSVLGQFGYKCAAYQLPFLSFFRKPFVERHFKEYSTNLIVKVDLS